MELETILKYVQLVISIAMTVVILLQTRGSGMGAVFGGGGGSTFKSRRGMEAVLFNSTVVLGIVFAINAIAIAVLNVRAV